MTPTARTQPQREYPVIVTLPLPSRDLSPNARGHWGKKARAAKKARNDGYLATVAARIDCQHKTPFKTAEAHTTFYVRDNRRRDADNLLASLKPSFDSMVDAGLLVDDCGLVHMPMTIAVDKLRPRVEILIRERLP